MDKLTLTLLAEHQPRRALKWRSEYRPMPDGWSSLAWCAACAIKFLHGGGKAIMELSEPGVNRHRCNRCDGPLEFDDKVGLT